MPEITGRYQKVLSYPLPKVVRFAFYLVMILFTLFQQTRSLEELAEILVTATLLVQCGYMLYMLLKRRVNSPLWRVGAAFAVLFLILGPAVMVEQLAYTRAMLPLTLVFNLLIIRETPPNFLFWFITGNAGLYIGLATAFLKMIQ
jgi:hypothetical protein